MRNDKAKDKPKSIGEEELAPVQRVDHQGFNGGSPPTVVCQADPPSPVVEGAVVILRAKPADSDSNRVFDYEWTTYGQGELKGPDAAPNNTNFSEVRWKITNMPPRSYTATVVVKHRSDAEIGSTDSVGPISTGSIVGSSTDSIQVVSPPVAKGDVVPVSASVTLKRAETQPSDDQSLWVIIRNRTQAISFNSYKRFIDSVMCGDELPTNLQFRDKTPFLFVDAYNVLKFATEAFLMQECGISVDDKLFNANDEAIRLGRPVAFTDINKVRDAYLEELTQDHGHKTLPYFNAIRARLSELPLKEPFETGLNCYGILRSKLTDPCLLELIWSYWHEEGMLVQGLNAISFRFQNRRIASGRDPLAHLDIDPIRPLNNLLWGYIQDEQHRLNVARRAYEYDHHYGLMLYGKAVPKLQSVDNRSKFIEAFHNLLYRTTVFFKADDDTTKIADGFEVLNALREVHLLLAHGAHNQFGDLPSTARAEMLIEMWLLARPEVREFIGGKIMVPYSEPWMDRLDTIKTLQGWTDVSATYFHDLAVFGEQLLLSARYGHWTNVNHPVQAANWARYWRPEIQRYIHAYRAVTGVDLTIDVVDAQRATERFLQPSVHLRNRLAVQIRNR